MGVLQSVLAKIFNFDDGRERRCLMVGLDGAGKTTLLYKMKLGEVVASIPTIGFNVERVKYRSLEFTVWDIGGQNRIRKLWHHYYNNNDAIIFVVDSNDVERMDEVRDEIKNLCKEDLLANASLLVFANKQDLPRALSVAEMADKLELTRLPHSRHWHIQACSATTGDGLYEGFDWMVKQLKEAK